MPSARTSVTSPSSTRAMLTRAGKAAGTSAQGVQQRSQSVVLDHPARREVGVCARPDVRPRVAAAAIDLAA